MGWQTLEPVKKSSAPQAPVRVSMRKMGRAGKARAKMSVIVEAELLDKLAEVAGGGASPLLPDRMGRPTAYTIQLGSGAEAHQLRIVLDPKGPFERAKAGPKGLGKYVRFALPAIDRFPDRRELPVACDHSIDKTARALVVDLPSWAWLRKAA